MLRDIVLRSDRVLRCSLGIAASLALYGSWWGPFDSWDFDQLALRTLIVPGHWLLEPTDFMRAPFVTYLNFFLSVLPIKALERFAEAVSGASLDFDVALLWWSRMIQVALFLGAIVLAYQIVLRALGVFAARLVAITVATSAGFVLHAHFLREEMAAMFFMLASFLVAQNILIRGRTRDYVAAGALAGVAAATEYNGLAVAGAIPVFHYLANRSRSMRQVATDGRLLVALSSVVAGFVVANPYSLIEFHRFASEVVRGVEALSSYHVEARVVSFLGAERLYVGEAHYAVVPFRIAEILGWPMALMASVAVCASALVRKSRPVEIATFAAALAVFAVYLVAPDRFLAAGVPFFLIAAGSGAMRLARSRLPFRQLAAVALAVGLAFNVVASVWVGYSFASDPRVAAESWVRSHVPPGSVIESTPYSPEWSELPGMSIQKVRMPYSRWIRVLSSKNGEEANVTWTLDPRESDAAVAWYSPEALESRHPDFICLDWLFYTRFFEAQWRTSHPEVGAYLRKLLNRELGYEIVFDQSLAARPDWLFPYEVPVESRTIILRRSRFARARGLTSADRRLSK